MILKLLLIQIFYLCSCSSDLIFDVKRYIGKYKENNNEPYKPVNYFVNKNSLCFFSYCWNRGGKCKGSFSCCECECKDGDTFFSATSGCNDGTTMVAATKRTGTACEFVTKKLRYSFVPLFVDQNNFKDIEITLSYDHDFAITDKNTLCEAGSVHVYDYHGHRLLYHRNKCNELFVVKTSHGQHYLQWQSPSPNKWDFLKGQLISVEISCANKVLLTEIQSCLLFQIEGKYMQGDHWKSPTPSAKQCPTTVPVTWIPPTEVTTTTATTELTTTVTTIASSKPTNSTAIVGGGRDKQGGSSNMVGIGAGIATVLIIGIVVSAIFYIIIKRRKTNQRNVATNGAIGENLIKRPTRHINDEKEYLKPHEYVAIDDDKRTYSSIDDQHHYETTNGAIPDKKRNRNSSDMSKRPLPDKPQEMKDEHDQASNNIYYCAASDLRTQQQPEEKISDDNDLYTLYDTIDAVKS